MHRFLLGLAMAAGLTTVAAPPAAQAAGTPPAEVHRGECFPVDGGPWTDPGGTRLFGHAWGVYYGLGSAVLNHYGGRLGFCEVARAYVARVTEGPPRRHPAGGSRLSLLLDGQGHRPVPVGHARHLGAGGVRLVSCPSRHGCLTEARPSGAEDPVAEVELLELEEVGVAPPPLAAREVGPKALERRAGGVAEPREVAHAGAHDAGRGRPRAGARTRRRSRPRSRAGPAPARRDAPAAAATRVDGREARLLEACVSGR